MMFNTKQVVYGAVLAEAAAALRLAAMDPTPADAEVSSAFAGQDGPVRPVQGTPSVSMFMERESNDEKLKHVEQIFDNSGFHEGKEVDSHVSEKIYDNHEDICNKLAEVAAEVKAILKNEKGIEDLDFKDRYQEYLNGEHKNDKSTTKRKEEDEDEYQWRQGAEYLWRIFTETKDAVRIAKQQPYKLTGNPMAKGHH